MEMTRITCCPQTGLPVLTMVSVVASVGRVLLLICIFQGVGNYDLLVGMLRQPRAYRSMVVTLVRIILSGQVINAGVRRILMVFIPV